MQNIETYFSKPYPFIISQGPTLNATSTSPTLKAHLALVLIYIYIFFLW
jgi:hypothetical protein